MTAQKMSAQEIIAFIGNAEKKTNVKVTFEGELATAVPASVTKLGNVLFGDWKDIEPLLANLTENKDYVVEQDGRNSAVPLLDKRHLNARIEPGAIIRDQVTIEDNAVVMMGAVINIGAEIGAGTMIDMGAILGGRATVGKNSHIGAGAVLAGVIEPASAEPVRIGDNVLVGANAVVIEGVQVGNGSVVAAGAIVTQDVPENVVVAGVPARIIKEIDEKTQQKTATLSKWLKIAVTRFGMLFFKCLCNPYCTCNGCAYHWVIAHSDKAHHINMSRYGRRTCKLCVTVHSAHGIRKTVRCRACAYIVRVQGSACAAAGCNGEVFNAVVISPLFVCACNKVLESCWVCGVAGD